MIGEGFLQPQRNRELKQFPDKVPADETPKSNKYVIIIVIARAQAWCKFCRHLGQPILRNSRSSELTLRALEATKLWKNTTFCKEHKICHYNCECLLKVDSSHGSLALFISVDLSPTSFFIHFVEVGRCRFTSTQHRPLIGHNKPRSFTWSLDAVEH